MTELQIGLLAIGALVVLGVVAYNRVQERRVRQEAERSFGSSHSDVLLEGGAARREAAGEPVRTAPRGELAPHAAQPDSRIDYVIELSLANQMAARRVHEQWTAIERRHAPRALLADPGDGGAWQAGLQLVSREGTVGEAELIEFRAAVENLAAAIGATASAPEMKVALDAAREIDAFCAEADVQVVLHVVAPAGSSFPGTKIRAAAEASGLALEPEGRFALRNEETTLVYTLGARDGSPFAAATMRDAAPQALTLTLDVPRVPDTRRSFESMARLAQQLASVLGGTIVDDNGNVLDVRALGAIASQLDAVRAKLESRGMAPGSPTALRLFS